MKYFASISLDESVYPALCDWAEHHGITRAAALRMIAARAVRDGLPFDKKVFEARYADLTKHYEQRPGGRKPL